MEAPEVFEAAHQLVLRLVGEGKVTGLRIDHPDGLYAPVEYFRRLQEGAILSTARRLVPDLGPSDLEALAAHYHAQVAANPAAVEARPLWIAAEKILVSGEPLPEWWVVAGTTGYDFLGSVNGLFVDRGTSRRMTAIYRALRGGGHEHGRSDLCRQAPHHAGLDGERDQPARPSPGPHLRAKPPLPRLHAPEPGARAARSHRRLSRLSHLRGRGRRGAERPRPGLHRARPWPRPQRRNPTVNVSVFDFVRDALLLRYPAAADAEERAERRLFAMRFQQITGPVTAKGVEDTAHYRYNRLVSLNEVGSDPARFGEPAAVFHDKNARRLARWPDTLLATATHDTKRGEDVRARINVLSEVPERWGGGGAALARDRPPLQARGQRTGRSRSERRVPALPDARRRLAPARCRRASRGVHRPHPRLHGEGDQGSQGSHELGESQYRLRRRGRGFVTRLLAPGSPLHRHEPPVPRGRRPLPAPSTRWRRRCSRSPPRASPTSTRAPSSGISRWSTPTIAVPSTSRGGGRRSTALPRASPPSRRTRAGSRRELLASWPDGLVKLYVTHRALTLRRARARLFGVGRLRAARGRGRARRARGGLRAPATGGRPPSWPCRASPRGSRASMDGWPLGEEIWGETWLSLGDAGLAGDIPRPAHGAAVRDGAARRCSGHRPGRALRDPARGPARARGPQREHRGPRSSMSRLGAHAARQDGVDGIDFAVWAPHARRVSVVGDWNDWDAAARPIARGPAHRRLGALRAGRSGRRPVQVRHRGLRRRACSSRPTRARRPSRPRSRGRRPSSMTSSATGGTTARGWPGASGAPTSRGP